MAASPAPNMLAKPRIMSSKGLGSAVGCFAVVLPNIPGQKPFPPSLSPSPLSLRLTPFFHSLSCPFLPLPLQGAASAPPVCSVFLISDPLPL
jgi:hypothetical protein